MGNILSKTAIQDAEQALCQFLDQVDTEAMLSAMTAQLSLVSIDDAIGDKNDSHPALLEIIAFYGIPRFGINEGKQVTHVDFNQCYMLAEQYLAAYIINKDNTENLDNIANKLSLQSEMVRGSAYPEQTAYRIKEVQGKFDNWFQKEIGITPTKAVDIIFALTQHVESAYNTNCDAFYEYAESAAEDYEELASKKTCTEDEKEFLNLFENADEAGGFAFFSKLNEVMPALLPVHIESLSTKEPVSKQEADALKTLIGISKDTFNQQVKMQRHPLYILNSGKVLLGNLSNCLDVLWDAFENIAEQDKNKDSFYNPRYQKFRGKWLEKKGRQYLERIFPASCIYQTLDYPNPDKDTKKSAELDIAIKWGSFLILVEAKASHFRFESVQGDTGRLRDDLKANIENPHYKQSLRAIEYINSTPKPTFIERETGRKLEINQSPIQKIYSISLSLQHLAGAATQLNAVQELGLFKEGNFPFSICLADLDLITQANITPETFLHYIERRFVMQDMSEIYAPDELGLFESYLNDRLDMRNMSIPHGEHDRIIISPNAPMFDHFAMAMRGEIETKPDLSLQLPEEILELLHQLSKRGEDGARWIAFNLLDADNELLKELAMGIFNLNLATLETGIFRRFSLSNDELIITVIGSSPSTSLDEKAEHLDLRGKVEKYRRKLNKSICIGIVCTGAEKLILDTVQYIEGEWEFDAEIENLIKNEPSSKPIKNSKLPKRNDPCFCGSGKKYKKCCLRKVGSTFRM